MIQYLGGLKRQYHHYKTNRDEAVSEYQPAMTILHEGKKGRSFVILLEAMWKYLPPADNRNAAEADLKEFRALTNGVLHTLEFTKGIECSSRAQAKDNMATIILAEALHAQTGILLCVCYNLVKCLRMFDITVNPQSASQLLMWIQDGLDTLKNMPDAPPEKELTAGEVTLWEGGTKVATKEVTVKESDLITEGNA